MPLIPKLQQPGYGGTGFNPNATKNVSFAVPPGAPRNLTPPAQHPTASQRPKPVQAVASPKIKGLLPTGDKTPFNVFGVPATQGAFNKEVNELAAPAFQPQLQQNTGDVASENALNKVRSQDISNVYNAESAQATKAFNDAKAAVTGVLSNQAGGNAAAQGYLNAALGSAGTPGDNLATMMGQAPTTNAGTLAPYLAANAGQQGAFQQDLAAGAGNQEGALANDIATPSMGNRVDQNTEAQRHEAELKTLSTNRATIIASIPDAIAKASDQLLKDIQAGQNSQFQENLANKQFSETGKVDAANIANQQATQALNKTKTEADIRQGQESLNNQATQIANAAAATKANLQIALSKATSTQQANAIKYLTSWAQPTAQELVPTSEKKVTSIVNGQTVTSTQKVGGTVNAKTWHRDAGNALETLMTVYGMNLNQALSLMSTINVPLGGGQKGTVAEWAKTFIQRTHQRTADNVLKTGNTLSPKPEGSHAVGQAVANAGKKKK